MTKYKPIVLIVLDGWGISPSWGGNALAVNPPKNINRLWREYPHKVLQAFTLVAGKYGVVGDSRLGHSTIAAGRRIKQDLEIISEDIANKKFYKNKVLFDAIRHAKKNDSNLHLIGLLSNGGIHAHISHLQALLELCYRYSLQNVYIDAITDGVDSDSNDALSFIDKIRIKITETDIGRFSSVVGRKYAMDRIGDFKKTEEAYKLLTSGSDLQSNSILNAISDAYREGFSDYDIPPTSILSDGKPHPITNNDSVIFFNFRSDRPRQLVKMIAGINPGKMFWTHKKIKNLHIVTFTEYEKDLPVTVAFPKEKIVGTLGEWLAQYQERQLRIAESEKASHVTKFFDCGSDPFKDENIKIIPSSKTEPIKNPQMKAQAVSKAVVKAIKSKKYDFILVNFANVDMVAHTGNMMAASKAIKAVDESVAKIVEESLKGEGAVIITADHGNIEQMVKLKPEQDPQTRHTLNPVPFILVSRDKKKDLISGAISSYGAMLPKIVTAKETLADIAPTVLELMGLPKPDVMTGHSLLGKLE